METIIADFLKKVWLILAEAFCGFRRNNGLTAASALAFNATLALIPAVFLLTVLLGAAIGSSQQALAKVQDLVTQLIPAYSRTILKEVQFISAHSKAIGVVNTIVLLWIITPLIGEMRVTLHAIFRARPARPFLLEKLFDVAITIVFMIGITAIAVAGVLVALAERFPLFSALRGYFEGLLPFFFVTLFIFSFYAVFSPKIPARFLAAGAAATALLWFGMRPAFNLFLTYNPGYGFTFGSFKSLFVVILWIYYSLVVFLAGAEVAAALTRKEVILVRRLMEGKRAVPADAVRKYVLRYEPGSVIFTEGDEGGPMYLVRRGAVSIQKNGKERMVIAEGKYVGAVSFLLSMPRPVTAVARDEVELVAVNEETFSALVRESPEQVLVLLREMALRLQEASELIE